MRSRFAQVIGLALLLCGAMSAHAQSSPPWFQRFAVGVDGAAVSSLVVHDDGSGPALFAAGAFGNAGTVAANSIAKWDGTQWLPLGMSTQVGVDASVYAMATFDDGTGPALYVGGNFLHACGVAVNNIARWKPGTGWSAVGTGTSGGVNEDVRALTVYDDGNGLALYAAGTFVSAGGVTAHNIAKWDGTAWSALGSGTNGTVNSLVVHDDGSGSSLFVGGGFTTAGGSSANRIARWNGSTWSALSTGIGGTVYALAEYADTGGKRLFAGGSFSAAGSVTANKIARWDGTAWTALTSANPSSTIFTLCVHDDGTGARLYAGGAFSGFPGVSGSQRLAGWDGTAWNGVDSAFDGNVLALASWTVAPGDVRLFAGGSFTNCNGLARGITWHQSSSWRPIGLGANAEVRALEVFDDGQGPALYLAGALGAADGSVVHGIGRIVAGHWEDLAPGATGTVNAMKAFQQGGQPGLFIGGAGLSIPGTSNQEVLFWDGTSWNDIGLPFGNSAGYAPQPFITALEVFDDGTGEALYAGGEFTELNSGATTGVYNVAKWDGTTWSPLCFNGGCGVSSFVAGAYGVRALHVFDDGSGSSLYVAGVFQWAAFAPSGGSPVLSWNVARWNPNLGGGPAWETLAGGLGSNISVNSLGTYNGSLFAGGTASNTLATLDQWDPSGPTWSAIGPGFSAGEIDAIRSFSDGASTDLYVTGSFATIGSTTVNGIAKWDGTTMNALGTGLGDFARRGNALCVFDLDETAPTGSTALFVAGSFGHTDGINSGNIGLLSALDSRIVSYCPGDGSTVGAITYACPCSNSGSPGHGCENSSSTGGALLEASGWSSVTNDTLVFSVTGEKPSATTWFYESNANPGKSTFGDGLTCIGSSPTLLYTKTASGGAATAPVGGDSAVHVAAGMGVLDAGTRRYYQVRYRDAQSYCTSSTVNGSNGLDVLWMP